MTNADQIRAMTDEELAEWIGVASGCCPKCGGFYHCIARTDDSWLEWLQKEADE